MMYSSLVSAGLWAASAGFFALACSCYLALGLLVSPRRLQPIARWVCRITLRLAGQRLEVSGDFPPVRDGPYLYVFNHTSLLDTLIMVAVLPEFTGAIGKQEQFHIPIWGAVLRRWGAVGIQRDDIEHAVRSLTVVEAAVRSGRSLLVAPEGTRSWNGDLGPFKKGPFHIAYNTQTPLVPVVIEGAFRAKNKGDWRIYPGTIRVDVGDPIAMNEPLDDPVVALRDRSHDYFVARLSALTV